MLAEFTFSGKVRIFATRSGTPTWWIIKLGSGEITVRAEKSTRFPDRLPRNRPCLPFNRWTIPRVGFFG